MIACARVADHQIDRCERASASFRGAIVPLLGAHPVPDAVWPAGLDEPQAFLVQQAPLWELPTHYHTEHQFQLVSAGSGTLGRHALGPITLHYASPETGYGPIVADGEGLDYYTLRARGTRDTWYLPKERARMRTDLRKQHGYGGPVRPSTTEQLRARSTRAIDPLMEGDDGLGAWVLRLPSGGVVDTGNSPWNGTRFYYVAAGYVAWEGRSLGPGDVASAQGAHDSFTARAGQDGAELVVLQFPHGAGAAPHDVSV